MINRTVITAIIFCILWVIMFTIIESVFHITEPAIYAVAGSCWAFLYKLVDDIGDLL